MANAWGVIVFCTRRAIALLIGAAVVSLQLVHPPHIHPAGIEGRAQSVVHSHGVGTPKAGTRASASHGDHRLAIYLAPIYESVLRNAHHSALKDLALPDKKRDGDPQFSAIGAVQQNFDRHPPGVIARASHGRAPPLG